MQKQHITQKDYSILANSYQLVMPLNLETVIAVDDSVRWLNDVLERLDYSKLMQAYSHTGRPPASPHQFYVAS